MPKQVLPTATISPTQTLTTNNKLTVALAGNPNAGKTTLFNALTGMRQKVANFAGVTVERKEGVWRTKTGETVRLIDLPGLYSLDASSIDEQIARDVLTGKIIDLPKPDVIIAIVDATNLDRNLYLVTQLLEYKIPMVVALTMIDESERAETQIDARKLARQLQIPVVAVVAKTRRGIEELTKTVLDAAVNNRAQNFDFPFFKANLDGEADGGSGGHSQILARYAWINNAVNESVTEKDETASGKDSVSEKLDGVLTHKIWGLPILIAILLFVFKAFFRGRNSRWICSTARSARSAIW